MTAWDDKFGARKNPYIEGISNYRDNLQNRFRVPRASAVGFLFVALAFPLLFGLGTRVVEVHTHTHTHAQNGRHASTQAYSPNISHECASRRWMFSCLSLTLLLLLCWCCAVLCCLVEPWRRTSRPVQSPARAVQESSTVMIVAAMEFIFLHGSAFLDCIITDVSCNREWYVQEQRSAARTQQRRVVTHVEHIHT